MQLSAGFVHRPAKRLVHLYALHYYGLGGTSAEEYKTKGLFCAANPVACPVSGFDPVGPVSRGRALGDSLKDLF